MPNTLRSRLQSRARARFAGRRFECLEPRVCLDSTVVFNEVMYNPAGVAESRGEWIELHNQFAVDMDISEWVLADGVDYQFPDQTIVPGRGYLIVAADPDALRQSADLEGVQILGPWTGRLSNSGETLRLFNNDQRLMNQLDYLDTSPWPAAADGGGASLVKTDPATASHQQSSWTFSRQPGGTPGRPNSAAMASPQSIVINEIAAADAATGAFFVEVTNVSDQTIPLDGVRIASSGSEASYLFPAATLAPEATLAIHESQLGFRPGDSDRLTLLSSDGTTILDGQRVTGRLRGRSSQHDGDWLYPQVETPGMANQFDFEESIVINEIMYHPDPQLGSFDRPANYERTSLVTMTDMWNYNASGAKLPIGWAAEEFAIDNETWLRGQAPMGTGHERLPLAINTPLTEPRRNETPFTTYYFQTKFEVSEQTLAQVDILELSHILDDAAVFYLNGEEIHRFNLPDGPIDPDTTASKTINVAAGVGPFQIPRERLQVGSNLLSVELHLRTRFDTDVVFATRLSYGTQVSDAVPGRDYRERSEEEWIELFNRGTEIVDLSDWAFADAIDYRFPVGTSLPPDQYLVVAKNVNAFQAVYPDVPVIGSYSGSLGDHDDHVRLLDAARNPADDVHYYDGGVWSRFADGSGSSLELRNPFADNGLGTAWAASDLPALATGLHCVCRCNPGFGSNASLHACTAAG